MERVLGGIAALTRTRPKAVLLLLLFVTALLGTQLPRVRVAYDPLDFLPEHPKVQAYRGVERAFGAGSFSRLIVVRFAPREGFSVEHPQAVWEMERVLRALRAVPDVVAAQGLPDLVKFVHQELHGGDPRYARLLEPGERDERGYSARDLIRLTLQRVARAQRFLSPRGTALVTARIDPRADIVAVAARVEQALRPVQQSARATEIQALSYGGTLRAFNQMTRTDLRRLTPAVLALVVGVLLWVFRLTRRGELAAGLALTATVAALTLGPLLWPALGQKPWRPLWEGGGLALLLGLIALTVRPLGNLYLPLLVVAVAGIWTFGALGLLGVPFSFLMIAVVPLLLGVGVDDTLHLLHRYEEERCRGRAGVEAMGIALRRTGRALGLTTLTTAAGFAALLVVPSPPLRAFGLLAMIAMLSAFLVTVLLVPSVKALLREEPRAEPWPPRGAPRPLVRALGHPVESWVSRGLRAYARRVRGRRGVALTLLLVGLTLGALGYWEGRAFQTYSVDHRRMLPPEHPLAKLYTAVNQEFRPYDEVLIVLRGDLARLSVMRLLLKDLPEALAGSPYAHKVMSLAQVLEDVRGANAELGRGFLERFANNPDGAYRWLLRRVWAHERLRAQIAAYARPLDPDGTRWEAVARVNTLRFHDQRGIARVTQDLRGRLAPVLERLRQLGIETQVTGTPYLEELGLEALRRSFVQSLGLSLLFCFVVLTGLFGSPRWGLAALGPVALVIGLVLGSVNALRIELNAATAVVAALGIGLGVDYAIHLLNRFREEQDLERAVARTGEALAAAFVTTACAFFALLLGQITWNRDFGLLVGLAVTIAFGATVIVLPALLALAFPAARARPHLHPQPRGRGRREGREGREGGIVPWASKERASGS